MLFVATAAFSQSSEYTVEVRTEFGTAVPAVSIYGTKGLNVNVTDSTGNATLSVSRANPTVALTGADYQFEPAQFVVNLLNCPNYKCSVTAKTGTPTAVIQYSI